MEPLSAMIISGTFAVLFFLVVIFNFARMGKNIFNVTTSDKSFDEEAKGFGNGMVIHIISGGLLYLSGFAFIASLVWLCVVEASK